MDDDFFHKLAEDTVFCEELLQVILQRPDLQVIRAVPQKSLRNINGQSVTVDVLCRDAEDNYYNIEVQKKNDDDHQERGRYNGSNVDTFVAEKGTKFKELPDVYVVYISSFDYFKEGKGRNDMCSVVGEYAEEIAKEAAEKAAKELIASGIEDTIIQRATKL